VGEFVVQQCSGVVAALGDALARGRHLATAPVAQQQRTPSPSTKLKRADAFARGTASGRHASRRQSFFGEHAEERPAMSSIDFDTVLPTW
jgi:hypothetical protein